MKNENQNTVSQKTIVAMNIYDYVQASGLSQSEVAKRAGISKSTLSAYITGTNYPRPEQMAALARVFGVSVGALTSSASDKAAEFGLDGHPDIEEAVRLLLSMSVRGRETALVLIRALMTAENDERYGRPEL